MKFNNGDKVIGNDKKGAFWGRKGTVVDYEKSGQYWVNFDDGAKEVVNSGWIDKLQPNPSRTNYE